MLRIDARSSRELRAILAALKGADREIQQQIRQQTKRAIVPDWQRALAREASSLPQHKVLATTGTASVSNQNVKLASATKGRRLSGGLSPREQFGAYEFGAKVKRSTYTQRSRKGKSYRVTRTTGRQFPAYNAKGLVFYPAVKRMVPRVASLWAQITVRVIAEALEGKGR